MNSYRLIGIVVILFAFMLLSTELEKFKVYQSGELVKMKIEELKCRPGTKNKDFGTFSYDGKVYKRRIGYNFCSNQKIGDLVKVKYLKGSNKIIFENESFWMQFLSIGIFMIIGLFLLFRR